MSKTNSESETMDGIHVSVRIRPLSSSELCSGIQPCCNATSKSSLIITKAGDTGAYLKSQATSEFEFAFDAVFDEHESQTEVYNRSAKPYVSKIMQGENVTIFAYGATGAGKTHTMFGNTRFDSTAAFAGAGIIPQAVADLFGLLHDRQQNADKGEAWAVSMSYMEVYNEQVCDLLETTNKNLPLREDPDRGVVLVAGLSEFKVDSYAQVLELLMKGQVNRKTEATKCNIVSSRSHAILQFSIVHTRRSGSSNNVTTECKLSLIDLAGSERASATQNSGSRLQESANINKSLLALANCINALSERSTATASSSQTPKKGAKKTNVKYRDSKLTHLLKGSLEGSCNLVMIANINPADNTHDDTYRTLQYANRAKNLKVKPCVKEIGTEAPAADREARLKEENEELRLRLAALEQNAQKSSQSEQQLLQALAQALEALNASKAKAETTEAISGRCNHHGRHSDVALNAASVSSLTEEALTGKKTKRDSVSPNEERRHSSSYNTRSSVGSTCSALVYAADGESDEENNPVPRLSTSSAADSNKARRLSTVSSPRGRSSNASSGRQSSGRLSNPAPRGTGRLSNSSTTGSGSGKTAIKPGRLSEDIVQQYGVLANVTQTTNRRESNASNSNIRSTQSTDEELAVHKPLTTTDTTATTTDITTTFPAAIKIDARYQYSSNRSSSSLREPSPPRTQPGFFARFLCGVKKQ